MFPFWSPQAPPAGEWIRARGGSQVARINFCKTRAGDQDYDEDDSDHKDDGGDELR